VRYVFPYGEDLSRTLRTINFLSSSAKKSKNAKGIRISHVLKEIGWVENILFPRG